MCCIPSDYKTTRDQTCGLTQFDEVRIYMHTVESTLYTISRDTLFRRMPACAHASSRWSPGWAARCCHLWTARKRAICQSSQVACRKGRPEQINATPEHPPKDEQALTSHSQNATTTTTAAAIITKDDPATRIEISTYHDPAKISEPIASLACIESAAQSPSATRYTPDTIVDERHAEERHLLNLGTRAARGNLWIETKPPAADERAPRADR